MKNAAHEHSDDDRERYLQRKIAEVEARTRNRKTRRRKLSKFEKAIVRDFAVGMKLVCGDRIYDAISDIVRDQEGVAEDEILTQEDVASRFEIGREAISKGQLSLEKLILMLTVLGKEFEALEEMPVRRDRFVGGYQEAVAYVWKKKAPAAIQKEYALGCERGAPKTPRIRLLDQLLPTCAVMRVINGKEYRQKVNKGTLSEDDWEDITETARQDVAEFLALDERGCPPKSVDEAKSLRAEWGDYVGPTLAAIQPGWWDWMVDTGAAH